MSKVYLKIPNEEEMHHRKKWMEDPKTMEYNSGYDSNIVGYNYETGTITKPINDHIEWLNNWKNEAPRKFYSFIIERETNTPIGEIYFYYNEQSMIHNMGILIDYNYREKHYSKDAIKELLTIAFDVNHIKGLSDIIPLSRKSAISAFKSLGFYQNRIVTSTRFNKPEEAAELIITRDAYNKNKENY